MRSHLYLALLVLMLGGCASSHNIRTPLPAPAPTPKSTQIPAKPESVASLIVGTAGLPQVREKQPKVGALPISVVDYKPSKGGPEIKSFTRGGTELEKLGFLVGDIFQTVNTLIVKDRCELFRILANITPGSIVPVVIDRNGAKLEAKIRLESADKTERC